MQPKARTAVVRPWMRSLRPSLRTGIPVALVLLLIATMTSLMLSSTNAATSAEAVPLGERTVTALTDAAKSCPALTPARLAGLVMATTAFEPTAGGGIAGLTAAQWDTWKPSANVSSADDAASLLALAHLTCDLVGQVRVAAVSGDPWVLAVSALRSSVTDVHTAAGVPTTVASFVEQVNAYAAWYAIQFGKPPGQSSNLAADQAGRPTTTPSVTPLPSAGPPTPDTRLTTRSVPDDTATTTKPPAVTLSFPNFSNPNGLRLGGSARVSNGRLDLATALQQAGSAWATSPIDPNRGFSTAFAAVVTQPTDGVAFVLQAKGPDAIGGLGGGLGYADPPITPSVAIELDTWDNSPDGFDPAGHQHIAVTVNGDQRNHLIWRDPGFDMHADQPVFVWVAYDAGAHVLTVYAASSASRPAAPLFTYGIDLRARLGSDRVYAGFTGGTGLTTITDARESILSWSLQTA